jgi:hypothetical protein
MNLKDAGMQAVLRVRQGLAGLCVLREPCVKKKISRKAREGRKGRATVCEARNITSLAALPETEIVDTPDLPEIEFKFL